MHHPGPTTQVSIGGPACLVAVRPDDLYTFAAGRRRAQEHFLRRQLALLIPTRARVGVARLVEEDDAARCLERHVRVVFDLTLVNGVARHRRYDLRLL